MIGPVRADQVLRCDAEVHDHREWGLGETAGGGLHLVPGRVETAYLLDHSIADGGVIVERVPSMSRATSQEAASVPAGM